MNKIKDITNRVTAWPQAIYIYFGALRFVNTVRKEEGLKRLYRLPKTYASYGAGDCPLAYALSQDDPKAHWSVTSSSVYNYKNGSAASYNRRTKASRRFVKAVDGYVDVPKSVTNKVRKLTLHNTKNRVV